MLIYESIKCCATSIHGFGQIAGQRADKFSRCVIRVCEPGVSTTSQIFCDLGDFIEQGLFKDGLIFNPYVPKPCNFCIITYHTFCMYDRCNHLFANRHCFKGGAQVFPIIKDFNVSGWTVLHQFFSDRSAHAREIYIGGRHYCCHFCFENINYRAKNGWSVRSAKPRYL